jgi:hypothetical protein
MVRDAKTKPSLKLRPVRPGDCEVKSSEAIVNFGQVVQPGAPRRSFEFGFGKERRQSCASHRRQHILMRLATDERFHIVGDAGPDFALGDRERIEP